MYEYDVCVCPMGVHLSRFVGIEVGYSSQLPAQSVGIGADSDVTGCGR